MAMVTSVNISESRGTQKHEVSEIHLVVDHGISGDAHSGDWHRQISLLAEESIDKVRPLVPAINAGAFAENINTIGIELKDIAVKTKLKIGSSIIEITQIGKECHNDGCIIKRSCGKCVMPTEGIFGKVIQSGTVKKGDDIQILEG